MELEALRIAAALVLIPCLVALLISIASSPPRRQ